VGFDSSIVPCAALGGDLLGASSAAGKRGYSAAAVRVPRQAGVADQPVEGAWTPPIVECIATRDHGVGELLARLQAHRAWLEGTDAGRARRVERQKEQMVAFLRDALVEEAAAELGSAIDDAARRVEARETDPYTAA